LNKTIGIIGYSDFSCLIAKELKPYFEVVISSRREISNAPDYVNFATTKEALSKDIIIPALPSQYLEEFFVHNKDLVNLNALVIDVCSVKIKPVEVLKRVLPIDCEILSTHPMFGPFSAKNGIKKLQIMVFPTRINESRYKSIKQFLSNQLGLSVIQCTPEEHDKELAYILGLTQLIGRAVQDMNIPETNLRTRAYEDLLDMKKIQGADSWDLFESITKENPYAKEVVKSFTECLKNIERKIY
jgi:prephenate dehydrogenase